MGLGQGSVAALLVLWWVRLLQRLDTQWLMCPKVPCTLISVLQVVPDDLVSGCVDVSVLFAFNVVDFIYFLQITKSHFLEYQGTGGSGNGG